MTLEEVSVTQDDHDLRAFREAEELLLLMAYDRTDGKFRPTSITWGALSVTEGRIGSLRLPWKTTRHSTECADERAAVEAEVLLINPLTAVTGSLPSTFYLLP